MAAIFTGIIDTSVGWNDNLSDGRANAISLDLHLDLIKKNIHFWKCTPRDRVLLLHEH